MNRLSITCLLLSASTAAAQSSGNLDLSWSTIDAGGGASTGGNLVLRGTIGQPDAGPMSGGTFTCTGGFWGATAGGPLCYANCDGSTVLPVLNVDDFTCFINNYAAASSLPHAQQITHYANCDGSTIAPALNVDDFTCFINQYAAGCP